MIITPDGESKYIFVAPSRSFVGISVRGANFKTMPAEEATCGLERRT